MRPDRVELGERRLVEGGILTERGDRERLQVEQLCVRWVLLWQDEVAEGDRQRRLRHQLAVGHDANEVLRWEGVGDWHGEGDGVVILCELLLEDEDLVVPDRLLVRVLHDHVKRLEGAVRLRVELEVGRDCKLDTQHRARDGLHVSRELEPRELVDEAVDHLTHLREADELANLLGLVIVGALPCEVLLLDLLDDVPGYH